MKCCHVFINATPKRRMVEWRYGSVHINPRTSRSERQVTPLN